MNNLNIAYAALLHDIGKFLSKNYKDFFTKLTRNCIYSNTCKWLSYTYS